MQVYVCTDHDGHYPVGVASIIVAPDEDEARRLLAAELREPGLDAGKPFTLRRIQSEKPQAFVLLDGNY